MIGPSPVVIGHRTTYIVLAATLATAVSVASIPARSATNRFEAPALPNLDLPAIAPPVSKTSPKPSFRIAQARTRATSTRSVMMEAIRSKPTGSATGNRIGTVTQPLETVKLKHAPAVAAKTPPPSIREESPSITKGRPSSGKKSTSRRKRSRSIKKDRRRRATAGRQARGAGRAAIRRKPRTNCNASNGSNHFAGQYNRC
jgi:hypothetical protein